MSVCDLVTCTYLERELNWTRTASSSSRAKQLQLQVQCYGGSIRLFFFDWKTRLFISTCSEPEYGRPKMGPKNLKYLLHYLYMHSTHHVVGLVSPTTERLGSGQRAYLPEISHL